MRSRLPARRDHNIQPANWQPLIRFLKATGLRREEVRDLCVRDVFHQPDGHLMVQVVRGKGGRRRQVHVLPGREEDILQLVEGRQPDEHVFERIPDGLDIHAIRRQFAQALYEHYTGKPLPEGKLLRLTDVDQVAALKVSRALGHNRVSVVLDYLSSRREEEVSDDAQVKGEIGRAEKSKGSL